MQKIKDKLPPADVKLKVRIHVARFPVTETTATFRPNYSPDVMITESVPCAGFWVGSPHAAGDVAASPTDEWELADNPESEAR